MGRIVVGVDGSEHARAALHWAADEARLRRAVLEVTHVYNDTRALDAYGYPSYVTGEIARIVREEAEQEADRLVDDLVQTVRRDDLRVEPVAIADVVPARALIQRAEGADMLVVGSRGRGGFAGLVLGSVSQQCAHHAPCPLVIIRTGG